jgi:hypothetical protein
MANGDQSGAATQRKAKAWRSNLESCSTPVEPVSKYDEHWTFGLKAPIIDFFENGYITEFADLNELLQKGAYDTMTEAYERADADTEQKGIFKMRWIHIPASNMEWVEVCCTRSKYSRYQSFIPFANNQKLIIKAVCQSKAKDAPKDSKNSRSHEETVVYLTPEYWQGQQRGCLKHCANNPVYARHMVPFFAEIPTGILFS